MTFSVRHGFRFKLYLVTQNRDMIIKKAMFSFFTLINTMGIVGSSLCGDEVVMAKLTRHSFVNTHG